MRQDPNQHINPQTIVQASADELTDLVKMKLESSEGWVPLSKEAPVQSLSTTISLNGKDSKIVFEAEWQEEADPLVRVILPEQRQRFHLNPKLQAFEADQMVLDLSKRERSNELIMIQIDEWLSEISEQLQVEVLGESLDDLLGSDEDEELPWDRGAITPPPAQDEIDPEEWLERHGMKEEPDDSEFNDGDEDDY